MLHHYLSLLAICHIFIVSINGQFLMRSEIDELREAIMNKIDTFSNRFTSADEKPLAAAIVRLAFHDCAGPTNRGTSERSVDNDRRICDGCINLDLGDHRGLEETAVEPMEEIFEQFSDRISRADFWIAAANVALEYTASLAPTNAELPTLPYFFGRDDCPLSPDAVTTSGAQGTEFPLAHEGWDHIHEFFVDAFDFEVIDTTAIVGAHTLGKAHKGASGFDGQWSPEIFHFDNTFYQELLKEDNQWDQTRPQDSGFPQWENDGRSGGEQKLMMLTADMSLILAMEEPQNNPHINARTGVVTCRAEGFELRRIDTCQEEVSHEIVERFARSNQAFYDAFVDAWTQIVLNNQGRLTRVTPNDFRDDRESSDSSEEETPTPSRPRNIDSDEDDSDSDSDSSNDGPFCCQSNMEPNWNGRCWGWTDPGSCEEAPPVGERCHWDPNRCRSSQTCLVRDEGCSSNLQCCSGRCRPGGMCR